MKIVQTAGRDSLGEFAPDFAHFNDDVLFGEVWNNTDIDLKIRSIITVVALMSSGVTDALLKYHLTNAKNHGVSQKEIAAIVTHAAFYVGWPKAWAALNMAKEIWGFADEAAEKERVSKPEVEPATDPNKGGISDAELLQKILMAQMQTNKKGEAIVSALKNKFENPEAEMDSADNSHLCPVCRKHKFANLTCKSVCPECGWQNDMSMEASPDSQVGEANDCSLNEFRSRYNSVKKLNPAYSYQKDGLPL